MWKQWEVVGLAHISTDFFSLGLKGYSGWIRFSTYCKAAGSWSFSVSTLLVFRITWQHPESFPSQSYISATTHMWHVEWVQVLSYSNTLCLVSSHWAVYSALSKWIQTSECRCCISTDLRLLNHGLAPKPIQPWGVKRLLYLYDCTARYLRISAVLTWLWSINHERRVQGIRGGKKKEKRETLGFSRSMWESVRWEGERGKIEELCLLLPTSAAGWDQTNQ